MTIADGYDTTHLNNLVLNNDLLVSGNATISGSLTAGSISDGSNITLANGKALQTDTTAGHTALLSAYYTTGTAYEPQATLTAGTTPTLAIAPSTHGAVTVDGVTLGGSVANTLAAGNIFQDIKESTGTLTSNSTTLANVAGLHFTVVPGSYKFRLVLQGVADGTGGIKYALNYTTTVVSALQATAIGSTASAIATQSTTSTSTQALLFDQAAAVLQVIVEGTMTVTTGGTIDVQAAQHAANASSTTVIGSSAQFIRIA